MQMPTKDGARDYRSKIAAQSLFGYLAARPEAGHARYALTTAEENTPRCTNGRCEPLRGYSQHVHKV
jgi:hypothetical protein